jgi:hypothetical protein
MERFEKQISHNDRFGDTSDDIKKRGMVGGVSILQKP